MVRSLYLRREIETIKALDAFAILVDELDSAAREHYGKVLARASCHEEGVRAEAYHLVAEFIADPDRIYRVKAKG